MKVVIGERHGLFYNVAGDFFEPPRVKGISAVEPTYNLLPGPGQGPMHA